MLNIPSSTIDMFLYSIISHLKPNTLPLINNPSKTLKLKPNTLPSKFIREQYFTLNYKLSIKL